MAIIVFIYFVDQLLSPADFNNRMNSPAYTSIFYAAIAAAYIG